MASKLLEVRREGRGAEPYHRPLGYYKDRQFIGNCVVDCYCGKRHQYDLYVNFDARLRGGWVPCMFIHHADGWANALLGSVDASNSDHLAYKVIEDILAADWWTIYCQGPDKG